MHFDDDIEQESEGTIEINNGTIDADSNLEEANSLTHQFRGLVDE